MDHQKEAERLLEKSLNGDTPGHYSPAEDAAVRLAWATQAQVHATLATIAQGIVKAEYRYGYKGADGRIHYNTGTGYRSVEEAQFDNDSAGGLGVFRRLSTTALTEWEAVNA